MMNIRDPSILSPVPTAPQPACSGAEIWKRRSVEISLRAADSAKPTLEAWSKNWAWPAKIGTARTEYAKVVRQMVRSLEPME